MTRVIIAGGPRTGKTTMAQTLGRELGLPVISSDDLIQRMDWSAVSEEVARQLDSRAAEEWIIEGVALARAMRKWMKLYPASMASRAVATRVIHLTIPKIPLEELKPGHRAMGKGELSVWTEILPALTASLAKHGGRLQDEERALQGGAQHHFLVDRTW